MYGKKYMGIQRDTFLIDKNGVIKKIWKKVKVTGHVDEVLKNAVNGIGPTSMKIIAVIITASPNWASRWVAKPEPRMIPGIPGLSDFLLIWSPGSLLVSTLQFPWAASPGEAKRPDLRLRPRFSRNSWAKPWPINPPFPSEHPLAFAWCALMRKPANWPAHPAVRSSRKPLRLEQNPVPIPMVSSSPAMAPRSCQSSKLESRAFKMAVTLNPHPPLEIMDSFRCQQTTPQPAIIPILPQRLAVSTDRKTATQPKSAAIE